MQRALRITAVIMHCSLKLTRLLLQVLGLLEWACERVRALRTRYKLLLFSVRGLVSRSFLHFLGRIAVSDYVLILCLVPSHHGAESLLFELLLGDQVRLHVALGLSQTLLIDL